MGRSSMRKKLIMIKPKLYGDYSNIYGDCSGLRGDCTGLMGDCSGVTGNLDECELTDEERETDINIRDLII